MYSLIGAALIAAVVVLSGVTKVIDSLPSDHPMRVRKQKMCCQKQD